MKVLYAIQATGNGHISRAREIIPHLLEFCQCDILVSGSQSEVELGFPVKYRLKGLSFVFGKKGGIDTWSTYSNANIQDLRREIDQLCVEDYNLVINDFEPVSAWACRKRNIPVIGLSHQGSLLNNNVPLPDKHDHIGRLILKKYAPASTHIGFHFRIYDQNIFTPVIRRQVREARTQELDYYTVYLPAYNDERIVKKLSVFENVNWHVFSKHSKRVCQEGNILIKPIADDEFVADMSKSKGVLCGAGFETPAEALFLHKKLMVIPIKGQYEQQCNAAALEELGVPVIKNLKRKNFKKMQTWLDTDDKIEVNYPDHTRMVLRRLFEMYVQIYSERNINKIKEYPELKPVKKYELSNS